MITLIQGDCLEEMKKLEDNTVDSIVTDPPYGLSFMGKKWDIDVPSVEIWQEAFRILKPGGHLISFGGTRTYHRMAVAIEDAGFEIRDMVSWIYGSGFPKSLNIGKAIDKLQGNEREVVGTRIKKAGDMTSGNFKRGGDYPDKELTVTKGNSPWEGWGTALKPAQEPCVLARKPLSEKTVAANVLKWGTGGLNIDGSRVGTESITVNRHEGQSNSLIESTKGKWKGKQEIVHGRFPANIIHDGSDEVLEVFPETKSGNLNAGHKRGSGVTSYGGGGGIVQKDYGGDSGSAARFFYCAKSSKRERTANGTITNGHPTIKPIALMEYMIKLITPPGGTVLDMFMGSGSTGIAAKNLGHNFIGIEREAEYVEIAKKRIES